MFKHKQFSAISYNAHKYLDNFSIDKIYEYNAYDFYLLLELEEAGYITVEKTIFAKQFYLNK